MSECVFVVCTTNTCKRAHVCVCVVYVPVLFTFCVSVCACIVCIGCVCYFALSVSEFLCNCNTYSMV